MLYENVIENYKKYMNLESQILNDLWIIV